MFGKFRSIINRYKWRIIILGLVVLGVFLFMRGHGTTEKNATKRSSEIIDVKIKHVSTPLYFNGKIEPLQIFNVTSPVEGVINEIFFNYGEHISVDQKLFSISAEKLEKEYVDSVSSYLKAMDDFSTKSRKFKGTEELWKLKFISDNDYYADKTAKEESFFMLKQSIKNLKDTLKKIGITHDLKELDIHNPHIVEEIITKKLDNYIIASKYAGIALDPKSIASVKKDDVNKGVGKEIKQGETLLHIGDASGIAVDVKVNEIDVNQIKPGQKAIVTGPGFSGFQLKGEVGFVKSQAHVDTSTLPTFPVRIVIQELTPEQRKKIRVGMSTKVEIKISEKDAIVVPIEAVFQNKGIDYVNIKDKKTGETKPVPVTVGRATVSGIEIEKGLTPGDKLVIDY